MTPELLKTEADNCDAQSGLSPAPLLGDPVTTALNLAAAPWPRERKVWMEAAMEMAKFCTDAENCDQAAMRVLAAEVRRLREAMEKIINQQPCCEGGGCFYPMHDGEGNYIGEQNVDPLSVIGGMVETANRALSPNIRS